MTEERVAEAQARLAPVETLWTERRGQAAELAAAAEGDELWVVGGDGLINEVLNGIRPGVAIGIVAAGHSNVLARALGGRPRRISLGRVNGRRFAFAAGIGVDSDVVREMETVKRAKQGTRPGDLAYARYVAGRLLRGYDERLEVRGMGRAAAAFVSNDAVFTYAGPIPLRVSRPARFELGSTSSRPSGSRPRRLRGSSRASSQAGASPAQRGIRSGHDLDRIEIVCDVPLPLQADGEDLGDVTEAVFEAERNAVSVLV